MKYEILINNKFFETNSTKKYNDLVTSKEILAWMDETKSDYKAAAIVWDYTNKAMKFKLCRAGYKGIVSWHNRKKMIEEACLEHIETGEIVKTCAKYNVLDKLMRYRMGNNGYSFVTKSFSLTNKAITKTSLTTKLEVPSIAKVWECILYTKLLSYDADFVIHQPYSLRG